MTTTKPALPGIFNSMLLALNAAVTSSRSGFAAVGSGLSVVSFVRPVEAEAEAAWAGVAFMAASSSIVLSPPTPKAPGMTLAFVEESGVPQADPGSVFNLSNIISALFANVWRQLLSIFNAIFGGGISVNSVSVSGADYGVGVRKTVQLSATVLPGNATNRIVTWSTSNRYIATVNVNGVVTGVSPGSVTITASAGGKSGSKTITVNTFHSETRLKNYRDGNTVVDYLAQGFAVGTDNSFSVEVNTINTPDYPTADTAHRLWRYSMSTDTLHEMTNVHPVTKAPLSPSNKVALGHANDMALATWTEPGPNGTIHRYLFVIAQLGNIPAGQSDLVKLEYSGNNYWEVARYNLVGTYTSVSRVRYYDDPSRGPMIQFLLRRGDLGYYTASVRRAQTGTHNLETTHRFNVTRPTAYDNYSNQSIHYENDKLYVTLWGRDTKNNPPLVNKPNENVILVYNAIDSMLTTTQIDSRNWGNVVIIKPFGSGSNDKFEIEGIGFPASGSSLSSDTMWFNTNEGIIDAVRDNGGIYTDSQNIK